MTKSTTRYTRRNFPEKYRDPDRWPVVELGALDGVSRVRFENFQRAARGYLRGEPITLLSRACGISHSDLLRRLNRALAVHSDGRIWGWRAFLPYARIREYRRLRAPGNGPRGLSGAFRQLLADHPELEHALHQAILTGKIPDAIPESRSTHRAIHGYFKRLCRQHRLSETHYPFSTKDRGSRALRRYVLNVRSANFAQAAARLGGHNASVRSRVGTGHPQRLVAQAPFDLVSMDEHRLNFIGCLGLPMPDGSIASIPIHRLILIPVFEHYCRLVLGYSVAIAVEPSAGDVVAAVRSALSVWKPRKLSLPGFSYPPGAALPSGVLPEAVGLCWNALLLDNAMIHYAHATADRMPLRLGCAINFGPVGAWYRRPFIEALFSLLERYGFIRLPNSTGTGPDDPLKPDASGNAVKYTMMVEEMLDLIDVIICTYNATSRTDLDDRSPLEMLSDALSGARGVWLPRRLPALPPSVPELDVTTLRCTVRGNIAQGRRPYIQTHLARYTNPTLSQAPKLIGQELIIHLREDDLRTVKAFLPTGAELGILSALDGWAQTKHNKKLRAAILSEMRDGQLVVPPGHDAVQAFMVAKHEALRVEHARRTSSRPRISPGATALARAMQITGSPLPSAVQQGTGPKLPTVPKSLDAESPPSFVPLVRHRGLVGS